MRRRSGLGIVLRSAAVLLSLVCPIPGQPEEPATSTVPRNEFIVTTTDDAGEGSLRQAILDANAIDGANTIRFDSTTGPFATPQTIVLTSKLPDLTGELTIDGYIGDRLWQSSGVTVSGDGRWRVFRVAAGARVTIESLAIAGGRALKGAGIANEGTLMVKGVTFSGNTARRAGGGLANLGGEAVIVNSTFTRNSAAKGGGMANIGGTTTVTNCTFYENEARRGGGLASSGSLLLRNTILANSLRGADCLVTGFFHSASTNNLIESNGGCGTPISSEDPLLEPLGYYNGPTKSLALSGASPAINLGDNDSAVDEDGVALVWDQRGEGDPRFVGGITDIGAFEHQRLPVLVVDTVEDHGLRGCTPSGSANCPLRGAIELAEATGEPDVITFDPDVFSIPRTIVLTKPLPTVTTEITLDADGASEIVIEAPMPFPAVNLTAGIELKAQEASAPPSLDEDSELQK
jgi:hypothetical protein